MQSNSHPLTEAHYNEIQNALAEAQNGLNQVAKAKLAGIDLPDLEQEIKEHQAKLIRIKNVYFPGR